MAGVMRPKNKTDNGITPYFLCKVAAFFDFEYTPRLPNIASACQASAGCKVTIGKKVIEKYKMYSFCRLYIVFGVYAAAVMLAVQAEFLAEFEAAFKTVFFLKIRGKEFGPASGFQARSYFIYFVCILKRTD